MQFKLTLLSILLLLTTFFTLPLKASADNSSFSDDFSAGNLDNWNIESGNWSIIGEKLIGMGQNQVSTGGRVNVKNKSWQDFSFELDVDNNYGVDEGIGFRYTPNGDSYEINLRHGTGQYNTPEIILYKNQKEVVSKIYDSQNISLVNSQWYHLKIEAIGPEIKLSIDNNQIFDITDTNPINEGTAGLSYWTGDVGSVIAIFDNVKISPINKVTKTPLIFIPGIGGSELKVNTATSWSAPNGRGGNFTNTYSAGEKIWINELEAAKPGNDDYFDVLKMQTDGVTSIADIGTTGQIYLGAYGKTIQYFQNNGYTLDKDLFIFPFDWRKDIATDVPLLDQKISQIKQQTGAAKVDLVAHSMGGLVARSYISDPAKAPNVRKFVSLGTPYLGTPKFLKALMYGECITSNPLLVQPFCVGLSISETKDVLQNSSGAYQLSPSLTYYNFYNGVDSSHPLPFRDDRDIDNNQVVGPLNYLQTKTLLNNLGYNGALYNFNESLHSLDSKLANTNGVEMSIVVGSGQPTVGQIVERNLINLAGIQIPKKDLIMINGDDTVPLYSASLNDSAKNLSLSGSAKIYYEKLFHESLPVDDQSLTLVKNILDNIAQVPNNVSNKPFPLKGTLLSVYSPVNLDVYDKNNNHTGLNSNGDAEENIPGSTYITLDDTKFIWLPDDGNYTVKFAATDKGSFDYKVQTFNNDQVAKTVIFNDVPLTISTKGQEILDTTQNPGPLQIDSDGNGSIDQTIKSTKSFLGSAYDDKTPPEAQFSFNPYTQDIELKGIDDVSSVLVSDLGNGQVLLKDDAGNTTGIVTDSKDKKKKDKIALQTISYNQGQTVALADNRLAVIYKADKNNIISQFDQTIIIKGEERLKASYDPKTNKTKIITKENGQDKSTEFKDGAVILTLTSQKGILTPGY